MPAAGYLTPILHVADIARSLAFYGRLGFTTVDLEGDPRCPNWARAHCEGGALMFVEAEESHAPGHDRIALYLYTPDLPGLRAALLEAGVQAAAITRPPYMPSGEMRVEDPDGFVVFVGHWGEAEHAAWEEGRARKREAGWIP